MTEKEVQKEIEGIRKVTNEALKSKESTLQLLVSAGILPRPKEKSNVKIKK